VEKTESPHLKTDLISRLNTLEKEAIATLDSHSQTPQFNTEFLEELKAKWVGKKGLLTEIMKDLGKLSGVDRPEVGQVANKVREKLFQKIDQLQKDLQEKQWNEKLTKDSIDLTLPGRRWLAPSALNQEHPAMKVQNELVAILERCGFLPEIGPEVEHEFFNFDALNIPPGHPARAMQDTFYIQGREEKVVLRTHTSPVQIRTLLRSKAPIRMTCPGRVFRSDYDATHSPMFHQIEGLLVDENVSMGDLIGILNHLVSEFFGSDLKIRLRPSFFPFTEPSAEIDTQCPFCVGEGCKICKSSGWIEIGGSGMVDPEVFKAVGWDPDKYRGFAFGMGIERMTMIKYGVQDLRSFFESDGRFLSSFAKWRFR
jgi:phenylalanyl-tRNA synthetase alpha chain